MTGTGFPIPGDPRPYLSSGFIPARWYQPAVSTGATRRATRITGSSPPTCGGTGFLHFPVGAAARGCWNAQPHTTDLFTLRYSLWALVRVRCDRGGITVVGIGFHWA